MATVPKLLDQIRDAVRARHYSIRTERTYLYWIRQFIRYHSMKHPKDLGEDEVAAFLSHLAVRRNVAPNTQRTALNALVFLYTQVLGRTEFSVSGYRFAQKPRKLPVVLSREELTAVFAALSGTPKVCAQLMYGSGLRVMEVVRLRVHDIDFERLSLLIRDGKGSRQRVTTLAGKVVPDLKHQLEQTRFYYREDLGVEGWAGAHLPYALARKTPAAPKEWGWQYVFAARDRSIDPQTDLLRRHHIAERTVQRAFTAALRKAGIDKPASCHSPPPFLRDPPARTRR